MCVWGGGYYGICVNYRDAWSFVLYNVSITCSFLSFIDHLAVMFGDELPPWDTDRKYQPHNLQVRLGLQFNPYHFCALTF